MPFEYRDVQYPKPLVIARNMNLGDENVVASEIVANTPSNMCSKLFSNTNTCQYPLIEIFKTEEKSFISNKKDYLTREYQKWLKNIIGFE